MSHPLWYTDSMIIKNKMKKANNLILGAIYINGITGKPCRLLNILHCQGVWMEDATGDWSSVRTVKFEDVYYASDDEVQDFLEDLRVYTSSKKAPSHKDEIVHRGFLQEDDETYFGCDTITAPDGNDYPIRDYS